MTNLSRKALETVAGALGRARQSLVSRIGDNALYPAALLRVEAALCRLRGSTLFHDSDYCENFPVFKATDLVGLGIQGARIIGSVSQAALFPAPSNNQVWSPEFYGPPCPEGWGLWRYDAWASYHSSPLTEYYGEPNNGAARLAYTYPVRYDNVGANSTNTYQRVTLWESAKYISFYNSRTSAVSPSVTSVSVTLTADDIAGFQVRNPLTDLPRDLSVYSHPLLVQGVNSVNITEPQLQSWQSITLPVQGESLVPVAFTLSASSNGKYTLTLNVPQNLNTWAPGTWWHVVLYWRSTDPNWASSTPASSIVCTDTGSDIAAFQWPRKNFFNNSISDRLAWEADYVNDSVPHLVALGRVHYAVNDGNYSVLTPPSKCNLPDYWPASSAGLAGALVGYVDVPRGSAAGILLAVSTGADGSTTPLVVVGPEITPEFWPADWADCPYFPPLPYEAVLIARVIVVRASEATFGIMESAGGFNGLTQEGAVYSNLAIAWIEQLPPSHAVPPLGDTELASNLLPALTSFAKRYRSLDVTEPIVLAAFNTLVSAAGLPSNIAPNRAALVDPAGLASKVFLGLLKNPFVSILVSRPSGEPLALPFGASARGVIEELASAPPSTELLRLESDSLSLTEQVLGMAKTCEFYMVPSSQCASIDANAAGTRLGRDYTFRLTLEDGQQNTLTKNLYVMASKYFLTPQEFAEEALKGTTTGYFTQSTLASIDQWRLYGYAGIIPDLSMGMARPLLTRVVSPPDNTKVTEAQFIANLVAQGNTQAQINEAIRRYTDPLEGNNTFYVVDLSQYGNDFALVKNASLSVTTYSFDTVPYYTVNFSSPGPNGAPGITDPRADSFFIAQSGLPVGSLESRGPSAAPLVRGGFNVENYGVAENLAPRNPCRSVGAVYSVESSWAFDIAPLPPGISLSVYPRATLNPNTAAWEYVRFSRDIWVIVRISVGGVIVDKFVNFSKYDTISNIGKPSPISLGPDLVDSVVFLGVGKLESDLQTATHGAPPGDVLVLRSS